MARRFTLTPIGLGVVFVLWVIGSINSAFAPDAPPVPQVRLSVVDSIEALGSTARGDGGFGSTGSGAVPLGAPAADSVDGQLGLFAAVDRGPMEV